MMLKNNIVCLTLNENKLKFHMQMKKDSMGSKNIRYKDRLHNFTAFIHKKIFSNVSNESATEVF